MLCFPPNNLSLNTPTIPAGRRTGDSIAVVFVDAGITTELKRKVCEEIHSHLCVFVLSVLACLTSSSHPRMLFFSSFANSGHEELCGSLLLHCAAQGPRGRRDASGAICRQGGVGVSAISLIISLSGCALTWAGTTHRPNLGLRRPGGICEQHRCAH